MSMSDDQYWRMLVGNGPIWVKHTSAGISGSGGGASWLEIKGRS